VRRRLLPLLLVTAWCSSVAAAALAHPLGNFTANTFTRVEVGDQGISLHYVLDLAELPTVQVRQRIDADGDGQLSLPETAAYADERCADLADGLVLTTDDVAVPILSERAQLAFPAGDAGLVTHRLTCDLTTPAALSDGTEVRFEDTNDPGRIGWREVVADGARVAEADVPADSPSDELRAYPADRSPLDVTTATITVGSDAARAPSAAAFPAVGGGPLERVSDGLTGLMGRQELTFGFGLLAMALALVLGTTHALAPGHGKTVMAAYLVSREGTLGQMVGLGATVAVTHTIGVLVLGVLVTTTQALAPERLYPWLGIVSGALFAAIGLWLLRRSRSGHHDHGHGHGHDHHHHGDGHHHHGDGHGTHVHATPARPMGWRALVLPGLAGGMLPSPSALVVLVAGIALGRLMFGLALVLAYGVGMALTLVAAGWLLVRMRHRVLDRLDGSSRWARASAVLPSITAGAVVLGGVVIVARSALTL
jgi:nickel/cobalt exporter